VYRPFPETLKNELLALNQRGNPPQSDELHRAALASNALGLAYAQVVHALLVKSTLSPAEITAIGIHGQTVRHQPGLHDTIGYSLQLNSPALLAEHTQIDVIADFRSRDIAAGGQGAPLAPAFHAAIFQRADIPVAVMNLGGFSNITLLRPEKTVLGFDCGPANVLMDAWCQHQRGHAFDAGGEWAASGHIVPDLLQAALADAYFLAPPPKSTGRDHFHFEWIQALLRQHPDTLPPEDVQATLCELTAVVCAQDLQRQAPDNRHLWVCGGGALNTHLLSRLQAHLPGYSIQSTSDYGLPPLQVEACAFAWLASAHIHRKPGNLPEVTGARGPRILGALYPGSTL
jgi:anhydro-N-acetylmuramic acid kinase